MEEVGRSIAVEAQDSFDEHKKSIEYAQERTEAPVVMQGKGVIARAFAREPPLDGQDRLSGMGSPGIHNPSGIGS